MLQTFADIQTFAESKTYVLNSVKDLDYKIQDFCRDFVSRINTDCTSNTRIHPFQ